MDIMAFYELQDRLYHVAAAGCGIITEDFRLKRAVDGLAPLAEKGKVFGSLKARCESLLTAGDGAAPQLSDCIALADAIAVTLGQTGVTARIPAGRADAGKPADGSEAEQSAGAAGAIRTEGIAEAGQWSNGREAGETEDTTEAKRLSDGREASKTEDTTQAKQWSDGRKAGETGDTTQAGRLPEAKEAETSSNGSEAAQSAGLPDTACEEDGSSRVLSAIWEDAGPVQDIPYSLLSEIFASLERSGETVLSIPKRYPRVLADVRFAAKLIEGLNGKSSAAYDTVAQMVIDIYGRALVPALKESIDLSDEKAKGRQVALIRCASGAKENAWYRSLAMNEKTPQKVRLAAIAALSDDPANEPELMELYHTQKGKLKKAACEALVRMGADGIQPYLEKICAKETLTTAEEELICLSSSPVCEAYAINRAKQYVEDQDSMGIVRMLENKTGRKAEEGYLALLEGARKKARQNWPVFAKKGIAASEEYRMQRGLERALVNTLFEGIDGAQELILRLYEAQPDSFAGARVYVRLFNGTLTAEDFEKVSGPMGFFSMDQSDPHVEIYDFTAELARLICAVPVIDQYKLVWSGQERRMERRIGSRYPDAILKVLTNEKALKHVSSVIRCCNVLVSLWFNSMNGQERAKYKNYEFYGAFEDAGSWESGRFEEYASLFFKKALKMIPALYYGCNIYLVMPDNQGREDWYWEWIKWNMSHDRTGGMWNYGWYPQLPDERILREVDYAIERCNRERLLMNKEKYNRTMDMLKRYRDRL